MKLYVIRHGETNMGKNNIIATEDEPLNEAGIRQAIKVGKEIRKLNVNKVILFTNTKSKRYIEII